MATSEYFLHIKSESLNHLHNQFVKKNMFTEMICSLNVLFQTLICSTILIWEQFKLFERGP